MTTGRPKKPFILTDEERAQLESIANSRSLPHGFVTRVRIVLMSASNKTYTDIAPYP